MSHPEALEDIVEGPYVKGIRLGPEEVGLAGTIRRSKAIGPCFHNRREDLSNLTLISLGGPDGKGYKLTCLTREVIDVPVHFLPFLTVSFDPGTQVAHR